MSGTSRLPLGAMTRMAWRNLWRNHRRTLIMLLAISVGVWAMIFMTALMRGMVDDIHRIAIGVEADLTLVLDLAPDKARVRDAARGSVEDRFERFGADFQTRLRAGFLELAAEFPDRCRVVGAGGPADDVAARVALAADL